MKTVARKTLLSVFVLAACWGVSLEASAQLKVGFVNVAKVLEEAPQAEDARGRIEREFAPKDRELLGQQKEIRSLEDRLLRDGTIMAEAERAALERQIRSRKREVRRMQEEFREDLNMQRNQELGKLQRKVLEAIQTLAEADAYDLIVSDGVLFAGKRIDITDEVISRLKDEFDRAEKPNSGVR